MNLLTKKNGIIAYLNVKDGDFISGAPSGDESEILKKSPFVIFEDHIMELTVKIPAFYAGLVNDSMAVKISPVVIPPEYRDKTDKEEAIKKIEKFGESFEGKVYSVAPVVDESSRSIEIKVRFNAAKAKEAQKNTLDGQQLSCEIILRSESDLPVIPMNAVLFENNQPFCFVENSGQAVKKMLTIELSNVESAAVTGVEEGDSLITKGKHNIFNGASVEVQKKEPEINE